MSQNFTLNLTFCDFIVHFRFLVFPNMGCSLQSVLEEENEPLSERAVLQLACRIVSTALVDEDNLHPLSKIILLKLNMSACSQLDVLEFIHSNEYVHADINAENIYIKPGENSQVKEGCLVGNMTLCCLRGMKPNIHNFSIYHVILKESAPQSRNHFLLKSSVLVLGFCYNSDGLRLFIVYLFFQHLMMYAVIL